MMVIDIDDAWDCGSIEQKLGELRHALIYPIGFVGEVDKKIRILEQRKIQLGCQ